MNDEVWRILDEKDHDTKHKHKQKKTGGTQGQLNTKTPKNTHTDIQINRKTKYISHLST